MGAYNNLDQAFAGLGDSLQTRRVIESWIAMEEIPYGSPVFGYEGVEREAYLFHQDESTIVFSADFVTDNVITTTVNGTEVVTNFDTDQGTTMDAIKADLESAIDGLTVTLTDKNGDNRTLELFLKGEDLTVTSTVTDGVSQATATITVDTQQIFLGVAYYTASQTTVDTEGSIETGLAFNVLTYGRIWAKAGNVALQANKEIYVGESSTNKGLFVASAGYTTKCFAKLDKSAGDDIVLLEVNGVYNGI